MSNLPKWISVEEHLPDNEQYVAVYSEDLHWKTNEPYFRIERAKYISDIKATIAEDECGWLWFDDDEIKGIDSGFFVEEEDIETCETNMILVNNAKYWMHGDGLLNEDGEQ